MALPAELRRGLRAVAPRAARATLGARVGRRALARLCADASALVLTYDDGPGRRLTPRLLELLDSRGAHATFFALGGRAGAAAEVLDKAVAGGHEIGCHGHAHVDAICCAPGAAATDIELGYRALARWLTPDALYRPPHGNLSRESTRALARRGAQVGWWTVDSGDALPDRPDPTGTLAAVARAGGGVVLMHDFDRGPHDRDREQGVLELTGALLDLAERHGLVPCTLGTLLAGQGTGDVPARAGP